MAASHWPACQRTSPPVRRESLTFARVDLVPERLDLDSLTRKSLKRSPQLQSLVQRRLRLERDNTCWVLVRDRLLLLLSVPTRQSSSRKL